MTELRPDRSGQLPVDGQEIHWEYFGRGDREAVCLLNGLAMHTRAWYGLLPLLTADLDVLLYDYLGQGESSAPDVPYSIPRFADYLAMIVDHLAIRKLHLMGISYGGFVALDYARLYGERLLTLTLSGILLTREELFQMYEDISLRFYRSGPLAFELYTHYMYEKIFGETFVGKIKPSLESMRVKFFDRYKDRTHCLIRLTEAQDPFFASLEDNLPGYRAARTPTLIMAGAQDRAIPPWVQRKVCDILPRTRFEPVEDCGHVVYLEKPEIFFGNLKAFARAKSLDFPFAQGHGAAEARRAG